ncbi:MAG: hypothetical protein HKO54_05645, partial [Flavobacteriaceae bacterium]|nr:hypothetical protein [Flavobacteriaceae bacterium]
YEGLPKGTRIVFTNMSENVTVKPKKQKAEVANNDISFLVTKPMGEVTVVLKAKQAGGWLLNYRLEFPPIE